VKTRAELRRNLCRFNSVTSQNSVHVRAEYRRLLTPSRAKTQPEGEI
jgi:hypothetical protein